MLQFDPDADDFISNNQPEFLFEGEGSASGAFLKGSSNHTSQNFPTDASDPTAELLASTDEFLATTQKFLEKKEEIAPAEVRQTGISGNRYESLGGFTVNVQSKSKLKPTTVDASTTPTTPTCLPHSEQLDALVMSINRLTDVIQQSFSKLDGSIQCLLAENQKLNERQV